MSKGLVGGLAILFSWCALAAARPASGNGDGIPGYQRIDLARGAQNHLIAPALVNGQPANLLLDTGVALNLLQNDRATRFGLRSLGQDAQLAGQNLPVAQAESLQVGSAKVGAESFALFQSRRVGGPIPGLKGGRADGILGLEFLRRHRAVINCRTRHMFLPVDARAGIEAGSVLRAGFTRIAIEEDRRGYLTVPCSIQNRPGRMLLDTGAFLTGVDDDLARSLGLLPAPSRLTARGFNGKVQPVQLAQINDLQIGGFHVPAQKFLVLDVFGRRKAVRAFTGINRIEYYRQRTVAAGDTIFGLLGNELLDQHRAIIDLGSMSLFLK